MLPMIAETARLLMCLILSKKQLREAGSEEGMAEGVATKSIRIQETEEVYVYVYV